MKSREDVDRVIAGLIELPQIDVKDFIVGESDVDVISDGIHVFDANKYNVTHLDTIRRARIDEKTRAGQDEIKQGFIPVEKIRLGRRGFVDWPIMGDGAKEIFDGKISIHYASDKDFASTDFAQKKINHPILLTLRYLRLAAMSYYYEHGRDLPNETTLLASIDPDTAAKLKDVITKTTHPDSLREHLKQEKFQRWLTKAVQKAFRSYTNPTAAKMLFDHFGVGELVKTIKGFPRYNNFVFAKKYDTAAIEANFRKLGIDKSQLFTDAEQLAPGLELFHGTKKPGDYRAILFQGVLPSKGGSAGRGLYAVPLPDIDFAVKVAETPNQVVKLKVKPTARVVDISTGYGEKALEAFKRVTGGDEDAFAEAFGIDILKYSYVVQAFVVKNSESLEPEPEGYKLKLMSFTRLWDRGKQIKNKKALDAYFDLVRQNGMTGQEFTDLVENVAKSSPDETVRQICSLIYSILEGKKLAVLDKLDVLASALRATSGFPEQVGKFAKDNIIPHLDNLSPASTALGEKFIEAGNPMLDYLAAVSLFSLPQAARLEPERTLKSLVLMEERLRSSKYNAFRTPAGGSLKEEMGTTLAKAVTKPWMWEKDQPATQTEAIELMERLSTNETAAIELAFHLASPHLAPLGYKKWAEILLTAHPVDPRIDVNLVKGLEESKGLETSPEVAPVLISILARSKDVSRLGEMRTEAFRAAQAIVDLLKDVRWANLPNAERVIDVLVIRTWTTYPSLKALLFNKTSPWSRHPRAAKWLKALDSDVSERVTILSDGVKKIPPLLDRLTGLCTEMLRDMGIM